MITICTAAERPDLWKISNDAPAFWPGYNMHGDVVGQWWGLLDEELPQFQFVLYDDEAGSVAARGLTGPLAWNGQDEALPAGYRPGDRADLHPAPLARSRQRPLRAGR